MATSSSPEEDDDGQPQEADNGEEEEEEEEIEEEVVEEETGNREEEVDESVEEEVEEIEEEVVEEVEEVEEVVEEEVEEEEDEEEGGEDEEGDEKEEGVGEAIQEGDKEGPPDSSVALHVDAPDVSQRIGLDGIDFSNNFVCSTLKKSELMLEPQIPLEDKGCSKLLAAQTEVVSSKENKVSKVLDFSIENKNVGALSDKGVPSEAFDICENNSGEADSYAKSCSVSGNDFHPEYAIRGGSCDIKANSSDIQQSRKEMDDIDKKTSSHSADETKRIMMSTHTPQQRPRSLTPDAEFNDRIKRPAIICNFFARGWCIKGNSCRFLHQKIGVDNNNTTQLNKGDPAVSMGNDEKEHSGLGTETGRLRSSTSVEQSFADCSPNSKPPILFERLLSKEEVGLSRGQYQAVDKQRQWNDLFPVNYDIRTFQEDLSKFDIAPTRGIGAPSLHEEISPNINPRDDIQSSSEELVSGKYSAGKMLHETQKGDSSHDDEPFAARASHFDIRNNSIPQSGYFSGTYGNDKSVLGSSIPGCSSHMSFSSLPTTSISTSHHILSYAGAASPDNLDALISRNCSSEKLRDFNREYFSSRSALLPQGSLPHYSVTEVENLSTRNMPADSVGSKSQSYSYDWEPSVRFQSSFCCPPSSISSPGKQYDPLRDSIDPPVGGNGFFQTNYQSTILGDSSIQKLNTDLVSAILSRNSSYIGEGPAHSLVGSHDNSSLGKNLLKQGVGENATEAGSTGTSVACEENRNSVPKEEKSLSPFYVADTAEVKESKVDGSSKHPINKGRHKKDSKTMKIFHSALVSNVKELIKPSWREGHLSKDAHKKIVKKVVDKVLNSLHSHQIPHTTESIERYLSSSQSKLAKLVEGYIEKYGNSKT